MADGWCELPAATGASTMGKRGAAVGAEIPWPEVSGKAIESRLFTRDNWNYQE